MNFWKTKQSTTSQNKFADLEFGFLDLDGKPYHRFPASIKFPLERHARRCDIATWMSAGMTNNELKKLVNIAVSELENLVAGKKGFTC